MTTNNVISLLGGVALFLFGMLLMGDGLKKVAGNKLELILYKLSATPFRGVLLGTGVTAVIQSSSATSVMVVGFVNSGMMTVRQAIGVIMGSIIGTSITGWVICLSSISGTGWVSLLSTSTLSAIVAVVGIFLRMFCKSQTKNRVGDILLGFAVLMFGMQAMSSAVSPLRESEAFLSGITHLSNPLIGILLGLVFTAIVQSASAACGILQALSATGVITYAIAFPVLLGITVGASLPVLLSAIGANVHGKRTAFVYLIVSIIGSVVVGAVFYIANAFCNFSIMSESYIMNTFSIAIVNSLMRVAMILIQLPLIRFIGKIVTVLIRESESSASESVGDLLDDRFIAHPALAIEQCRVTLDSMAMESRENLVQAISLLTAYSSSSFEQIMSMEDVIDNYEDRLGSYLMKLTAQELSVDQNKEVMKFLHTISDFERISDHAVNIAEAAKELNEKKLSFSEEASRELSVLSDALREITMLSTDSFVNSTLDIAYRVEPLEEIIDSLCDEMKLHHIDRLQKGICTISLGFIFNDLLTDFERVSDHCSNIAIALIELESDVFDTHEYAIAVKDLKVNSFDRYFDEYRNKYKLDDSSTASAG